MSDYYMGQELNLPELPANSPRPPETPAEGIIVVDHDRDGYVRRYLYKAMGGESEEVLLSAVPMPEPEMGYEAPAEAPAVLGRATTPMRAPVENAPVTIMSGRGPSLGAIPAGMPGFTDAGSPRMGLGVKNLFQNQNTMQPSSVPLMGESPLKAPLISIPMPERSGAMGGPTSFLQKQIPVGRMAMTTLGQTPPPPGAPIPTAAPPAPQPPGAPLAPVPAAAPAAAAPPPPGTCPGPLEMPDGKIIQPDDTISLKELCELFPFLLDAYKVGKGGATPGQTVPISRGGLQALAPNPGLAGFPSMGPSTGTFGGGGGSRLGQTAPGVRQGPSVSGGTGPQGPEGPSGLGGGLTPEFLVKTDGDFVAGPGSFVPVPGTLMTFSIPRAGSVVFLLQAVLGCGPAATQNGVIGLRIDGVDRQLNPRLLHTMGSTVEEFYQPVSASWPDTLAAGSHTVEVILRGSSAGEFCSAAGLGISTTVSANPDVPLGLTVLHESQPIPSPSASTLVVDGVVKTDGDFAATGALTPVPGLGFTFAMQNAGRALFEFSAVLSGSPFSQFPSVQVGLRVDGADYVLWFYNEEQGSGGDKVFKAGSGGSIPLNLAAGSHRVDVIYVSAAGGFLMVIQTTPSQPATLSVVHP